MKFGLKNIFSQPSKNSFFTNDNTVLLTGIPRSGTTLACKLLLDNENTIALNEPLDPINFRTTPNEAIQNILSNVKQLRVELYKKGIAPVRTKNGEITDNAFDQISGNRINGLIRTNTYFAKPLTSDFKLILKHNAEFTLLLTQLVFHFPVFAIIRNPLACLLSWNSVNIPVSRGKVSKASWLNPQLEMKYNQIDDLRLRQVLILNWYFEQIGTLPVEKIIKYEEVIHSGGIALSPMLSNLVVENNNLKNMNYNSIYPKDMVDFFTSLLLQEKGEWSQFYSEEDIEGLSSLYS